MKIAILVNSIISFMAQADALAKGIKRLDIETKMLYVDTSETTIRNELENLSKDYILISVANWVDFENFVMLPTKLGFKTFPWIVNDDYTITPEFAKKINDFGLLITPSEHCKRNFVRGGANENIIHVIPEAIDTDLWKPNSEDEKNKFLKLLSDPNPKGQTRFDFFKLKQREVPIIYITGGHPTKKGAQEVMKALAKIDKNIEWIFILKSWIGTVLYEKAIEELNLANELGIGNRIKYYSMEVSNLFMTNLMNICDIYAAPSRSEGFGLPLIEAMACGKPVVTSRGTSTDETVIHNETGFKVEAHMNEDKDMIADVDELSKYLEKLITNKDLRKEMGQNAIQHVQKNYSPETISTRFIELIQDLS